MMKRTLNITIFIIVFLLLIVGCNSKENERQNSQKIQPIRKAFDTLKLDEESLNQTLNWSWAKGATGTIETGGILSKEGKSIITDSKGNVYVVGDFHGETITFNNVTSNKIGNDGWNSFFTKYDSKGNVIWVKIIKEYDATRIAIDSKDFIYISCDGRFISKYNSDGEKIWEKNIMMSEISIAVASPNSFYLVGTSNYPNMSLVKYDSMGNILWSKELKTIDRDSVEKGILRAKIAVDNVGSIYIAGYFSSSQLVFENTILNRDGLNYNEGMMSTNGFIMKSDTSGKLIWAKNLGTSDRYNLTTFSDVVTDSKGEVYVVGQCDGNLSVGNASIEESAFLIKYNKNGDVQWTKSISNCGQINHRIDALTVNRFDNIYICGFSWCETLSFGKFNETAINGNLNFIAKYNSNGEELCTNSFGYTQGSKNKVISSCKDITTDYYGNIYVTGKYEGGGLQCGNSILSEPQRDNSFFIAKLNSENTNLISSQNTNLMNRNTNSNNSNSTKSFNDIQLTLTDATLKKAKIYLGEPDKYERYFGHITKGFAIYFNRVANQGAKSKHLILFLRKNPMGKSNGEKIEEIYAIEDNERACFGIHCFMIKNQTIYTNAIN